MCLTLKRYLIGKLITLFYEPTILKEWGITCFKMTLFAINFLFFPVTSVAIDAFRCTEDPATGVSYNSQYHLNFYKFILFLFYYSQIPICTLWFYFLGRPSSGNCFLCFWCYVALYISHFQIQSKVVSLHTKHFLIILWYYKSSNIAPGTFAYAIHEAFGFFFLHFRDRYYWFSLVILLRRFAISLIVSLVRIDSVLSFGLNGLILCSSIVLVLFKRPFRTHTDNMLEIVSVLCAFFIYSISVLLTVPEFAYGHVVVEVIHFLVNLTVLFFGWFVLYFLYILLVLSSFHFRVSFLFSNIIYFFYFAGVIVVHLWTDTWWPNNYCPKSKGTVLCKDKEKED